jgi:hypothetical protein
LAPTGFSSTNKVQSLDLSWNPVTDATNYRIFYGLSGSGFPLYVDSSNSPLTITGLTPGLTYNLYITVYSPIVISPNSTTIYGIPISPTPTGLTADASYNSCLLTWNPSSGATQYKIYYGVSGSFGLSGYFSGLSGFITGLTAETYYNFKISAIGPGGESPLSSAVYAYIPQNPPSTPTGLVAVAGTLSVDLSWNSSVSATSYIIYYGLFDIFDMSAGFIGTTGTITDLLPDISYGFKVVAVNSGGESARSSPVYATPYPPIPSTPSDLSGYPGILSAIIYWTDVPYATQYYVYYGVSGAYDISFSISSGLIPIIIGDLSDGIWYQFSVSALNSTGESSLSIPVYIMPLPVPPISPPTILSTLPTRTQCQIKYTPIDGAIGYNIYYGVSGDFSLVETITNINSNTYTILYLLEDTTYNIKIRSFNQDAYSDYSDIVFFKTLSKIITNGQDSSFITRKNDNNTVYQESEINKKYRINQFKFFSAQDRLKYIQGQSNDTFKL